MSDKVYSTVTGIIQFEPQEKQVNGKDIREVQIRAIGSGKDVRITIWPDYAAVPLKKGDAIYADGEARQNPVTKADGTTTVYNNLSCMTLVVIPQATKADMPRPVNQSSSAIPDVDNLF